uniref:Uncharacterized protein n=1 Tax=Panagrolaimus sp. PS1159 TaxID=55785 RepID=A0AC35FPG4_9BILA
MGLLTKVQTTTLLQIAAGTFLVGATGLYFAQKKLQDRVRSLPHYKEVFTIIDRVRSLPHYKEVFTIIGNHDAVKRLLGPPIAIGRVNLADRRNNFVSETDSNVCYFYSSFFLSSTYLRRA